MSYVTIAAILPRCVLANWPNLFGNWRAIWDDFRNWLQLGLEARERT